MRNLPIMVLYAVVLHIIWGIGGLADPGAYASTALSALYRVFGPATPFLCIFVAISAFVGVQRHGSRLGALLFMLPQQTFLIISAIGAIHAMMLGHFADGVMRSRWFIISDQSPAVLAAAGHTGSLLRFVFLPKDRSWRP